MWNRVAFVAYLLIVLGGLASVWRICRQTTLTVIPLVVVSVVLFAIAVQFFLTWLALFLCLLNPIDRPKLFAASVMTPIGIQMMKPLMTFFLMVSNGR